MSDVTVGKSAERDTVYSGQYRCYATVVPEGQSADEAIRRCQENGSVLFGLEGEPEDFYCVQLLPDRSIEVYTKGALTGSL